MISDADQLEAELLQYYQGMDLPVVLFVASLFAVAGLVLFAVTSKRFAAWVDDAPAAHHRRREQQRRRREARQRR